MLPNPVNPLRWCAERLRSREPRRAGGATRFRRVAWTLALLSPALIAVGRNDAVSGAVAAAIADPASILAARSPGGRGAGALAQSKPVRVAAAPRGAPAPGASTPAGFVPSERVLSQIRERPGAPVGPLASAAEPLDFGTLPLGPVASGFAGPLPTGAGGGVGGPAAGGGSFPSFGGGGGGGGGALTPAPIVPPTTGTPPTETPGPGTPTPTPSPTPGTPDTGTPTPTPSPTPGTPDTGTPTPPPVVTPPVVTPPIVTPPVVTPPVVTPPVVTPPIVPPISAVPEPSSWAAMILGFLAIGAALRRRARTATATVDAGAR